MPTTVYKMRVLSRLDGHADTTSEAGFENSDFLYNINAPFGSTPKPDQLLQSALFILEADGNPVPRTGKVTDIEITFISNLPDLFVFSADTSLLVDDGKWTQTGSGTSAWIGHPNSHLDFQFRAEDSGSALVGETDIGTDVDGSVTIKENSVDWLTPGSLCQAFTSTVTTTIETTKAVIWRVGTVFNDTFQLVYYNTLAQDGIDDRPDIAGGRLGRTNADTAGDLPTSGTEVTIGHTGFLGETVDVVSGTRYAVVFEQGADPDPGSHVFWGFKANTTGPPLYTDGSPSTFGIGEGFNNINYPVDVDLPSQIHADRVTENVAPFGSVSRDSIAPFPALSGTVTHASDGITTVFQEYFNRPDYDPTTPMGLCIGPGNADFTDQRFVRTMNSVDADRDFRTRVAVTWRKRKLIIT